MDAVSMDAKVDPEGFVSARALRAHARRLPREDFCSLYPDGALLVERTQGTGAENKKQSRTEARERSYRATIMAEDTAQAEPDELLRYSSRVALVRKRPGNPFPDMISIGRAMNNDIVISLVSISKVHAYLLRGTDGWSLTDCASTNGCTLNGERVAARTQNVLTDGTIVKLGLNLTFVYLQSNALYDRLLQG